jgi:C1A family cysteine protease
MKTLKIGKMGWQPDIPDIRDFTIESDGIKEVLGRSKPLKAGKAQKPKKIDLRKWCSPVEDQENLGSCTANAGVGLLEYYQKRAYGKYLNGSRLFLYKTTRKLLGWTGDTGAYLRSTMKAMVLFGIPEEKYWPYNVPDYEDEPTSFVYSLANNYKSVKYYRLDPSGTSTGNVLITIKDYLVAGLPSMFGFSVYSSIPGVGDGTGDIPFPVQGDTLLGGHAIVTVGYDDEKKIGNQKGALLIRNSWGTNWGENGYGWLPYAYVESGLADDFWSLVEADFVNTDLFKV